MKNMILAVAMLVVSSVGLSQKVISEQIQYRMVNIENFPDPACNILGIGYQSIKEDLLISPEFGLILAGTEVTIKMDSVVIDSSTGEIGNIDECFGAFGGGACLRLNLGFRFAKNWYATFKNEISYISLQGEKGKWSILELGVDFGTTLLVDDYIFTFDLIRIGVRPGGEAIGFIGLYPGFGVKYPF